MTDKSGMLTGTSPTKKMSKSKRSKPIAIVELRLSEGISNSSWLISQSLENSTKQKSFFNSSLLEAFGVTLNSLLGLVYCQSPLKSSYYICKNVELA